MKRGETRLLPAATIASVLIRQAPSACGEAGACLANRRARNVVTDWRRLGRALAAFSNWWSQIERTMESRAATTVAMRGSPAKKPTSPTSSPCPISAIGSETSSRCTVKRPDRTTKNRSDDSPWRTRISPRRTMPRSELAAKASNAANDVWSNIRVSDNSLAAREPVASIEPSLKQAAYELSRFDRDCRTHFLATPYGAGGFHRVINRWLAPEDTTATPGRGRQRDTTFLCRIALRCT